MPSLTPQQHADDTVWEAMKEGFASGGLAMIPSTLFGEIVDGVYNVFLYYSSYYRFSNI